jgi:lipoic acid synthetase
MVGFGETRKDIEMLLSDIISTGCRHITIGQYQQPTRRHWPVEKYYHPEDFAEIRAIACAMGFNHIESGPHVRSSYHASLRMSKAVPMDKLRQTFPSRTIGIRKGA